MNRTASAAALAALAAAATLATAHAAALDETFRLRIEREAAGKGTRAEVTFGEIDPRLQLAPCARVEPFVPAGVRLWGRTVIGIRCIEGASWSITMPIHVRVFAPALVAQRALAAGSTVDTADVAVAEVEITREPPGVLTDPVQAQEKVLTRNVAAGQTVRADMLRTPPVVAGGDIVRVNYVGNGFSVATDGKALSAAPAGGSVRVQLENGRTITGTARAGRVVEVQAR